MPENSTMPEMKPNEEFPPLAEDQLIARGQPAYSAEELARAEAREEAARHELQTAIVPQIENLYQQAGARLIEVYEIPSSNQNSIEEFSLIFEKAKNLDPSRLADDRYDNYYLTPAINVQAILPMIEVALRAQGYGSFLVKQDYSTSQGELTCQKNNEKYQVILAISTELIEPRVRVSVRLIQRPSL